MEPADMSQQAKQSDDPGDEHSASDESADDGSGAGTGIQREIGHDEFDPIGTLTLVTLYVGIVGLLWAFMYFVEFLGRPTPMLI